MAMAILVFRGTWWGSWELWECDTLQISTAQPIQPPQPSMDGSQLVQWLSVQAGNMAGDLQHNVRELMVRASSPMPVSDGRDEVSSLKQQLRHQEPGSGD